MNKLPRTIKPGEEIEVQIAPYGEYACRDGNPKHNGEVQRVTPEAVARLVANFENELLVDFDHASETTPTTEAAAWLVALRADPELGLAGRMKFTDIGAAAVSNRRYRFVSAAWYVDDAGAPERLSSVALTNKPNLPVRPMLNRAHTNTAATPQTTNPKDTPMEKLKTLLGLAPEATDEDVAAAVAALQKQLQEQAQAQAEREAEAFANENSEDEKEKEVLKNAYRAAPETAKLMAGLIKRPAATPVTNSQAAKAPPSFATLTSASPPALNALQQYEAMPEGKAKREFLRANAIQINTLKNEKEAANA